MIRCSQARTAWQMIFGDQQVVHFTRFQTEFMGQIWPQVANDQRFIKYLNHLFNFPKDNMMTMYRFNLLITLFGPFNQVVSNFQQYVLSLGFIGLVNMIKAEEILHHMRPQLTHNTVLIRFSRRQPELLAFTSINLQTGLVEHRRNINRAGQTIPIGQFLSLALPDYHLLQMGIDDVATDCETTFTFAQRKGPYICSHY